MNIKNIHIIGCGGIGSYFCRSLYDAMQEKQIDSGIVVTVYDDDEVEEKNTRYQCFDEFDITSLKVNVMEEKYGFKAIASRVTEKDLILWNKNNAIISCVDNIDLRRDLFKTCTGEETPYFIDLRSEGRFICYYAKHKQNTLEKLLESIDSKDSDTKNGSCQIPYRFANSIIDYGNRIIAEIGVQLLLNYIREETFSPHLALKI